MAAAEAAQLYSYNGSEYVVTFSALVKTNDFSIDEVSKDAYAKDYVQNVDRQVKRFIKG